MDCLNCHQKVSGRFCSYCGQKSSIGRITLAAVIGDYLSSISNTDSGWLRTLIDLSISPGKMINNYLCGKRIRYQQAGKYTLLHIVVFTIAITMIESHFGFFEKATHSIDSFTIYKDGQIVDATHSDETSSENQSASPLLDLDGKLELDFKFLGVEVKKNPTMFELIAFIKYLIPRYHSGLFDWLKLLIALWIPISTLFTSLIFFKNSRNLAEHLVINSYLYANILFIFIFLSPAYWLMPNISDLITKFAFFLAGFYLLYSYLKIFNDRPKKIIKAVLVLVLVSSTYIASLTLAISFLLLYIAAHNIQHL
jgi:hypothetical protein